MPRWVEMTTGERQVYPPAEFSARWDDLRFPAQGINPAGAAAPPTVDNVPTDYPGTLLFAGNTENVISGVAQMPHAWLVGSTVVPHIHVARTTSSALAVTWQFHYRRSIPVGGSFEAWQGPVSGTATPSDPATADVPYIVTFGDLTMSGYLISTLLCWRIHRLGNTDAYNANMRLFEFDINYQSDSLGSGAEFVK